MGCAIGSSHWGEGSSAYLLETAGVCGWSCLAGLGLVPDQST